MCGSCVERRFGGESATAFEDVGAGIRFLSPDPLALSQEVAGSPSCHAAVTSKCLRKMLKNDNVLRDDYSKCKNAFFCLFVCFFKRGGLSRKSGLYCIKP